MPCTTSCASRLPTTERAIARPSAELLLVCGGRGEGPWGESRGNYVPEGTVVEVDLRNRTIAPPTTIANGLASCASIHHSVSSAGQSWAIDATQATTAIAQRMRYLSVTADSALSGQPETNPYSKTLRIFLAHENL